MTSEVDWNAIHNAENENKETRKRLEEKSGLADPNSGWNPTKWKRRLLPWEFHFMLSDSFSALCMQGGLIHAFHCFFDNDPESDGFIAEDDVVASWNALQSVELPKLYQLARSELERFGRLHFDDLEPEEEEELEEILDEAWIGGGVSIEIRLANFARTNSMGEQGVDPNA